MKYLSLIALTIAALLLSVQVLAQDSEDGGLADDANACYEGGSLEGKCGTSDLDLDGVVEDWEIDLMWTCGWYLIRYEHGSGFMPYNCGFLLPMLELPPVAPSAPVCYTNGEFSFSYAGTPNQLGNVVYYDSTDCSGQGFVYQSEGLVDSPDGTNALTICVSLQGGSPDLSNFNTDWAFNTPLSYWRCAPLLE